MSWLSAHPAAMLAALQHGETPSVAQVTLHGHHIGKLDRFVGQAQRAAARAAREFDGVTLVVDARGTVSVHATGMTAMLL